MAVWSVIVAAARTRDRFAVTDWRGDGWRVWIVSCLGFTVLFVGLSVYLHTFAWSAGLDATSPEFSVYWRSLLLIELVGVTVGTLAWWTWLVRSGRALSATVAFDEEVRRIMVVWGLLGATCVVLYFMASFFVSGDAAWHQTAVRDTAFTPPHIVMFYCAFPLGITMTVGTYLYGVTRLPRVYSMTAGFPWSFFMLIGASVTEMLQVAVNEWGQLVDCRGGVCGTVALAVRDLRVAGRRHLCGLAGNAHQSAQHREADRRSADAGAARMSARPETEHAAQTRRLELRAVLNRRYVYIDRKWDIVFFVSAAFVIAAAGDLTRSLFAGDWDFWVDWKDRQWWPMVTPFATIIIPSAIQYIAWVGFRLPLGATYTALCLFAAAWIARVYQWEAFVSYPFTLIWPASLVPAAVLVDWILQKTRSFILTSILGGIIWTFAFWISNYVSLAPYLQPSMFMGHMLSVADVLGIQYLRSQTPEYLRLVESGTLRSFLGETQYVALAFGSTVAVGGYWIGQAIGRWLAIWPIGRSIKGL